MKGSAAVISPVAVRGAGPARDEMVRGAGSAERSEQRTRRAADFVTLTKPRLNFLVLITTLGGMYIAAPGGVPLSILVHALVGTALAATVAAATLVSYVFVYTPLKKRTSLATLVGAVPGALPPVIGWAAATGEISLPAIVLFGIVFLWQMPHFLAIAWLYRDDYEHAGIPLLPVLEPDGRRTGQQALLYAAALWPVSLLPAIVRIADVPYSIVATVLGFGLIARSGHFARGRTTTRARHLFL